MTKAEKMFKELGYEEKIMLENGKDFYYLKDNQFAIGFFLKFKEYIACDPKDVEEASKGRLHSILLKEHLAIHEQLKELGWLK